MKFVTAMKDYFGYPEGGLKAFAAELKQLTDEDKVWFRENLKTVGYEIEEEGS